MMKLSNHFPCYTEYDPLVPVYCVTPEIGRTIHRFFDTSPFSPSGRYMALFRLPQEERLPKPGESGEIVLVDLETGSEQVVASTKGWETQMGANLQWGADDSTLLYNDVVPGEWQPFCTVLNPFSGSTRRLGSGLRKILEDTPGSGHPSVHPNGRHILTDEYAGKEESFTDGTRRVYIADMRTMIGG